MSLTELEQECVRRIAEAKLIPQDSLTLETSLESLSMDSLDRISLSFDLEEQYGVEIPESKLQEIRTVGDVAAAIHEALLKREATVASGKGAA